MSRTSAKVDKFNSYLDDILSSGRLYEFTDKKRSVSNYIRYMLSRTQSMFEWHNLPSTIPQRDLELYLQTNGNACIASVNGLLYAFTGGRGGEPNPYYMPTIYTVANPALKYSKALKIDTECIVIPNDSMYQGLLPMFNKYASLLVENELSMRIAVINSRIIDLVSAPDDRTYESAQKFFEDIEDGKLGAIAENIFLDGIRSQPYGSTGNTNILTNLIETEQYLKASWFNELGLNANYNMKRESLNSAESQLNDDALLPLVDDMLKCRQTFAEKVNDLFGTEISVNLASSWEDNQIELNLEQASILSEKEETEIETEDTETVQDAESETEPSTDDTDSIESTDESQGDTNEDTEALKDLTEAINDLTDAISEDETDEPEDEQEDEPETETEAIEDLTEAIEDLTDAITEDNEDEDEKKSQ